MPIYVSWEKGVDKDAIKIVVDALRKIMDLTGHNFRVVLVGSGPWKKGDYGSLEWYLNKSKFEDGTIDVAKLGFLLMIEPWKETPHIDVVILKSYIRSSNTNFVFGYSSPFSFSIVSTYHFKKFYRNKWEKPFTLIVYHELGHLFGAPDSSREGKDAEWNLGLHCVRRHCVMEQVNVPGKLDALKKAEYVDFNSPYCENCLSDIKYYIKMAYRILQ